MKPDLSSSVGPGFNFKLANKATLIFSIIAMTLSAYAAYTARIAYEASSGPIFYQRIAQKPEILAESLALYEAKLKTVNNENQSLAAKRLGPALYNSTSRIGSKTNIASVVEFIDYRCTYCKASFKSIRETLVRNHGASVIVRQLPILGSMSKLMASYSLAALQQGKFEAVHEALLETSPSTERDLINVLEKQGVDVKLAQLFVASKKCKALLKYDEDMAAKIGLHGTPAFVVNGIVTEGWNEPLIKKALLEM